MANDNFSNEKKTAKQKPMIKMPKIVVEGILHNISKIFSNINSHIIDFWN